MKVRIIDTSAWIPARFRSIKVVDEGSEEHINAINHNKFADIGWGHHVTIEPIEERS